MTEALPAAELRKAVLAQLAAESYLDDYTNADQLGERLNLGANNYLKAENVSTEPMLASPSRMTDLQIRDFRVLYDIVHHRSNSDDRFTNDLLDDVGLNGSGFSATLLRDKTTGRLTLSIRSTEFANTNEFGDWDRDGSACAQIGRTGFAFAQLAALEQYYQELRRLGLIGQEAIDVTGFSLGAHLATAFATMHDASEVHRVVTFNGPGIGTIRNDAQLKDAIALYRAVLADPRLAPAGLDDDRALYELAVAAHDQGIPLNESNIYLDARQRWAEKAAQDFLGKSYFNLAGKSEPIDSRIVQLVGHAAHNDSEWVANSGRHAHETRVFIEDQPDISGLGAGFFERFLGVKSDFGRTHSITLIADSLAAMEVVQKINPSLSLDQLFELFAAASNQRSTSFIGSQGAAEGDSLERIAEGLRKLYTGDDSPLQLDRQGSGFGNRDHRNAYYAALEAASAAIVSGSDRLTSLAPGLDAALDSRSLAAAAKSEDGIATRHALLNLQPFVIDGADAARREALYARHNTNHELDLAAGNVPGGLMTEQYIDDRAEFLKRVLYYNRADLDYTNSAPLPPDGSTTDAFHWEDVVWSDVSRGIVIQRGPITASTRYVRFGSNDGDAGTTAIVGGGRRDSLYGMAGVDELRGLAGDDYLEGGLGDDRLEGGRGRDTLRGGRGADTFVIATGDGNDTIVDADSSDTLLWDGIRLVEGSRIVGGSFASTASGEQRFRYNLVPNDGGGQDLRITRDGSTDSVTIRNWQAASAPASTSSQASIESAGASLLGIQLEDAAPPAPPTTTGGIGGTAGDDAISDTALGELIDTGAGNDGVSAIQGGRDLIRTGSGDDFVFTGDADADWIELGIGRDVALGSLRDDDIFGDAGADRLDGGLGDDRLYGGDDGDLIGGGGDANIIHAGGGDDWVWVGRRTIGAAGTTPLAGHVVLAQGRDWIVQAPLSGGTLGKPVIPVYGEENTSPEVNIAYGDTGDDRMWGDNGADILDGGADNDVLVGLQAADLLIGGLGDDLLYGDGTRAGTGALDAIADASHGEDALYGGDGNDQLYGQGASDELYGGIGADFLRGDLSHEPELSRTVEQGDDLLEGGAGNDQMIGDGGNDSLSGGDGDDILYGDALIAELSADQHGNDRIDGGVGNDQIVGFGGHDTIVAGDGNDLVWADGAANIVIDIDDHGNDMVDAGSGDDYVEGGGGDDALFGGSGVDRLYGDAGNDNLSGGDQDDQLSGDAGDDRLVGGLGVDYLSGGDGADTYVLSQADSAIINGQADTIVDSAGGNVIAFGDGTTAADLLPQLVGNDLVLHFGSSAAYVVGGASGTVSTLRFADGSETSIERLLGERQPFAITRTVGSNQQALGGAAMDVLSVAAGATQVVVSTGAGDETVNVGAEAQAVTLKFNLGDGHDRVTFAASTNAMTRQPHVVALGAEIHPDEVSLSWRSTSAGRGDLTLHYADTDRVTFSDVAVDTIRQDVKFDQLRFADGSMLGWQALLDRGVRIELPAGADPALGTPLDDALTGDATSRTIRSGAGDDRITLGRGIETVLAQGGSDTIVYGRGDGRDTIDNRGGVAGEVDTLAFEPNLGLSDVRFLRQGDDLLAQVVDSPDDRSTLVGFFVNPTAERLAFGDGTTFDRSTLPLATPANQATAGNDTIYLTDLGETVDALAGDDQVFGGRGADRLRGNAGDDRLFGSAGSDVYEIAAGDGSDRIEDRGAAADVDVLRFGAGLARGDVQFERTASGSLLIRHGGVHSVEVVDQFAASAGPSDGLERIEFADGTAMARADIAAAAGGATAGHDVLRGTAGPDTIDGLAGNDQIYGEAGDDTLIGGDGNDLLFDGFGADVLRGGPGDDSLYASGDAPDQLFGGPGDDVYFDVTLADTVVELAGEGTNDRIMTASSVDLSGTTVAGMLSGPGLAHVEAVTLAPGATASAYGNALGNALVGNLQGNTLEGRDGDDYLSTGGGTGNEFGTVDTLRGGNGDDWLEATSHAGGRIVLEGGLGNDRYFLPNTDGFAGASAVTLTEAANGGIDTVTSGLRLYVLPSNVENLVLAPQGRGGFSGWTYNLDGEGNALDNRIVGNIGNNRLYGHAGNDTIIGDAGDDTLDGMAGSDVLNGGAGNDTYRLNDDATDAIVEAANDGFDTVMSSFSYTLAANLERLELAAGKKQLDGHGNALDNIIIGNSATNTLSGGSGNDTLSGRDGADTLAGDDGNDALYGEAGNDALAGGSGDDRLDGGTGNDAMAGGAGNDVYVVDSGRDTVTEIADGIDRVEASVAHTLAANVENLTLVGSSAINGTGNALANGLTGNAGNNVLAGGGGADIYVGGAGSDTIHTSGSAAERIAFARGHGSDIVTGSGTVGEDRLELSGGIARASVVLRRSSNNLVVDLGGGESVTLSNYYAGARNVGTLRVVNDANWTPGQTGTPQSYEDVDLFALAGGLANGAMIGLPASLAEDVAGDVALVAGARRRDAQLTVEPSDTWWSDAAPTRTVPLTLAHFDQAALSIAPANAPSATAPRIQAPDALTLAPLLQSMAVHAGEALPRAAIRSAWDRVLAAIDDSGSIEPLGGELAGGPNLVQASATGDVVAAAAASEPRPGRMTWWRGVMR